MLIGDAKKYIECGARPKCTYCLSKYHGNCNEEKVIEALDVAAKSLEAWDEVLEKLDHNQKVAESQGEFDEAAAILDCIRVIKEKLGELKNEEI